MKPWSTTPDDKNPGLPSSAPRRMHGRRLPAHVIFPGLLGPGDAFRGRAAPPGPSLTPPPPPPPPHVVVVSV
ncbi:hypothetical protein LX36DRAFT_662362 [Colletotrichum falcatum]|nr:hypothetical protein LX36DRAFT_662362 [Colletotrichum falcatum]